MPKLKTRKSVVKRFKFTKTGKVIRRQLGARHLHVGKSAKRLRNLKKSKTVDKTYAKRLRKALGLKKGR